MGGSVHVGHALGAEIGLHCGSDCGVVMLLVLAGVMRRDEV